MVVRRIQAQKVASQWLPLLIWMAAIFLVSNQGKQELPSFGLWDTLAKKGGHFAAYMILALLAHRAASQSQRPYLWAALITALYALTDEFHQTFVPSRQGSLIDVIIDCAGGAAALVTHYRWQRRLRGQPR